MKKLNKLLGLVLLATTPFTVTGCKEDDKDHKLNFIAENNKVYYSITSSGNEDIDLPEEPSRKGYTFGGWYLDKNYTQAFTSESLLNKDLDSDLTIYAKWDAINYNVIYHLEGGTNATGNPSTYNITTNKTLENPTKQDYTFFGWYLDEDYTTPVTTINSQFKGDLNVYAKWSVYDYEIVYHLDGAKVTSNNPSGYDANNAEIILEDLTRPAYDFLGWYSDSNYTTEITSIPANSTGKIEVYAKWAAIFEYAGDEVKGLTTYGESKNIEDLVIPEEIDGVAVKTIGVHAFYNGDFDSVNIPASVTEIKGGAFYNEDTLNVNYEGTLEQWLNISVGSNAFKKDSLYINDVKLQDVTIPTTVKVIKDNAFYGINVNKFIIHDEVTSIGKHAFLNSTDEESGKIYFDGTVEQWLNIDKGQDIFGDNYDLYIDEVKVSNLVVPTTVTEIKDYALSGLNVEKVTIHAGVTKFGKYAFDINEEIEVRYQGTIEQWLNVEKAENSLNNVKLYINDQVVTSVVVPESIMVIKENALIGLRSVVSVTLHDKLTTIESSGLNNGTTIKVYYEGAVEDWVKIDIAQNSINGGSSLYIDNNVVIDLIIGEEITEIKENAFAAFTFESVTIHDEVNTIGANAFMVEGEITIYCEASSKPSGWADNWQTGNTVHFGDEW